MNYSFKENNLEVWTVSHVGQDEGVHVHGLVVTLEGEPGPLGRSLLLLADLVVVLESNYANEM